MDASKQRFEQEYFRIGCYGMGFHDFLQVEQKKNRFRLSENEFYLLNRIMYLFIDRKQDKD
jgi:hypothetical protein